MPNPKIYVIHHEAEKHPAFASDVVIPILAGNVGKRGVRVPLRDNTGDHISDPKLQALYSEYTAIYWVWKNARPQNENDLVGFMHYRSFLRLTSKLPVNSFSFDAYAGYAPATIDGYMRDTYPVGLTGERLAGSAKGVDILTSPPENHGYNCIYDQFSACHPMADHLFGLIWDVLRRGPQQFMRKMSEFSDEHFRMPNPQWKGFFKNLFLMPWKYFDEYCRMIFYAFDTLYASLGGKMTKWQQGGEHFRLLAFFGERLTSLYLATGIKQGWFKVGTAERWHNEKLSEMIKTVYPRVRDGSDRTLTPLIRTLNADTGDHMTVSSYAELDSMQNAGYHMDGLLGYAAAQSGADAFIPLRRFRKVTGGLLLHMCTVCDIASLDRRKFPPGFFDDRAADGGWKEDDRIAYTLAGGQQKPTDNTLKLSEILIANTLDSMTTVGDTEKSLFSSYTFALGNILDVRFQSDVTQL